MLKETHSGQLKIGETIVKCAVLEGGKRIISRNSVFKAFGRTKRGRGKGEIRVPNMPTFIDANNLQPFISDSLYEILTTPVEYETRSGKRMTGYLAEVIPMTCDVYLQARKENALRPQQMPLADGSEVIVRALSKVGIIALVDEATGYEKERKRGELEQLLDVYISKELLPWAKMFPDEFYEQLFKLYNLSYDPTRVKRPSFIGKFTNKYVYDTISPEVKRELKNRTPKNEKGYYKAKFHQSLTEDVGHPVLTGLLQQLIILMRISPNINKFKANYARAFSKQQQLNIADEDDD